MSFVHPLFLVGTLAALVPVIIHLLTRDRVRKVAFSTLRFFGINSQKMLRRKKWQEMVLLAMRMLICALVAVAFARPFFGGKKDENAGLAVHHARVIVADVSESIARGDSAAKLKTECQRALAELSEGSDAVGLVMMGGGPDIDVSQKFDAINAAVDKIKPGQGAADIAAALETADGMLKNVHTTTKDVILISDLQRSGWNTAARNGAKGETHKLSPDVKLLVKSLAPAGGLLAHPDVAIVDHYCPESIVMDQTPQAISVKLANLSGKQLNDVPVKLTIAGKDATTQKINLAATGAGASMLVQFSHVFDAVGDTPIVVHLGADAAQTPENTVYFNARVMGKIPVVILNGSPSANRAADAGFFLALALSPKESPPFDVKTIDAAKARPEDIKDAAVVFLADVDKLKSGMNQALADLLQRGGGVMFLPGENVSANVFNEQFGGAEPVNDLAPCRLKAILQSQPIPGEVGGISLSKIDFGHAIFREFAQPHHGDFSGVRFFRWWDVRDYQGTVKGEDAERTRVLARFDDGRPALLERQVGRGESLLLASSTDLRWTNFAEKGAVFQPFVHLAAKYLSIRTEPKTAYIVGDTLPISEGCQLKDPAGTTHTDAEATTHTRGIAASEAGFYILTDKAGKQTFCYAVNIDPAEMDTATVTADEIASAVEQAKDEAAGVVADQASAAEKDGSHLWWYVTLAVAALFAMELFLANRTLRH